ncbi:MAG: MFS transporter [Acidimicrobiia bacterium]|nr:MFS transporter [Acidimicrobiia bacterium]
MTSRQPIPRGFWTVWTAVAVDLLGFGIIIPLLPLYAERFGASAFTIGLLFASYSLAQFVFSPVWGRISDRVGRRPILLVTIAGSAVGSLILGLAGSLPMLFVGRILDGASGASVAVARATVSDVAEASQRPRLMGLLGAAFGLGFVVGPSLGALAALGSPSLPFFVAAGISALNFIAGVIRIPETLRQPASPVSSAPVRSLPNPVLRIVALTFVGITAFSAFEATFSLLGSARLAMTESTVALVFAGVGLVLVATQGGMVGPITRSLGESSTIRLGLILNIAGFALLAVADSWSLLVPGLVLLAVGQGLLTPTLSSTVAGLVPERAGVALGVQQSAGGLARVAGPALGGALFAAAIPLPYVVAAGLTLVALPIVPRTAAPVGTTSR